MKRILSLVLSLALLLSLFTLTASADGEKTYNMPQMNTTDPITLTFVDHGWDRYSYSKILADKFMEMYPNITVEVIPITDADYNAALLNLISNDQMPDLGCAFYDVGPNISNKVLADLTLYAENDEEYQTKVPTGLRDAYMLDGEHYWGVAGMCLPAVVFLDQKLFEKMNVEMPSHEDFSMESLLELVETMTDTSQGIFGLSSGIGFTEFPTEAFNATGMGGAGWDGKVCDFTQWCKYLKKQIEMCENGELVYNGQQQWLDVVPDDTWTGMSGRVAMYMEAYWNIFNMASTNMSDIGIEWVPYMMPLAADGTGSQHDWANMYFVSSECEHPREAWELLKWMTWGKDGWMQRLDIVPYVCYDENSVPYLETETYLEAKARCDETGETMPNYVYAWSKGSPNFVPTIVDDEVNAKLASIMPELGYWDDWESFFAGRTNANGPIGRIAICWNDFWNNVYANGDYGGYTNLDDAAWSKAVDPMDYVQVLNDGFAAQQQKSLEKFRQVYGLSE